MQAPSPVFSRSFRFAFLPFFFFFISDSVADSATMVKAQFILSSCPIEEAKLLNRALQLLIQNFGSVALEEL